jgi:pimeloyl-ACP methyl ester carboxylesterase
MKHSLSRTCRIWLLLPIIPLLAACTHLAIKDCPEGAVLGNDEWRIRSSHYRMILDNKPAVAARFLPYAVMSAYAYRDGERCNPPPGQNPVSESDARKLEELLKATSRSEAAWERADHLEPQGNCEDDTGMMFNVWHRKVEDRTHVVIAFRGTSQLNDWYYGNFWWLTRMFAEKNQLTQARYHAKAIVEYYSAKAKTDEMGPPRIYTTGHSLGGGLAQHVLYAFPDEILQAVVFDPSAVTGFDDLSLEQQLRGCECRDELGAEARILRVYESGEILANLRIFHKMIFPPHRHIQEIRLPLNDSRNAMKSHAMWPFVLKLYENVNSGFVDGSDVNWLRSQQQLCTDQFIKEQERSCSRKSSATATRCPS